MTGLKLRCFIYGFLLLPVLLSAQDIFDAARKGDLERIKALVQIKADTLNAKNEAEFTALILAAYYNQQKTVEYLLEHGANVDAGSPEGPVILGACYKGNVELTRLLIRYKANVNAQSPTGSTALMYAVLANQPTLVKLLLANGADKHLREKSGKTALNYAELRGSNEIIALLQD